MILKNHNDGSCYKLIIKYMVAGDGLESEHIRYCEDLTQLFKYAYSKLLDLEEFYITSIHIMDDSK